MDPGNPVIELCAEGMAAEARDHGEARALFERAWELAANPYEACIAAHYLARHQDSLEATLYWNELSVERADAVADDRVRGFYASLLLNVGKAREDLGRAAEAREAYERARLRLADVPAGPYRDLVERGIAAGLARLG